MAARDRRRRPPSTRCRRCARTCKRVSLVVSWFGDDLRAGSCTRRAAGRRDDQEDRRRHLVRRRPDAREDAKAVSLADGVARLWRHALRRIRHTPDQGSEGARSRGRALSLRDDGRARPATPCRILTAAPASRPIPGAGASPAIRRRARPARPTAPAAAATQVERWFTRAAGFNRMVLHYADLAEEAGGVDGFILGSELVGLTRVRSASGRLSGGRAAAGLGGGGARDPGARPRRSSMRPTGRNTARMCSTAAARCASPSIRSSPTTTSTRSASTIIRRSPTGATAPTMPISPRRAASTTSITCAGASAAARRSTGTMPTSSDAQRADAHADHRRRLRQAVGLPRRRTSCPGGRTGMSERVGRRRDRRDRMACRNRSRSGSPRSAFPAVDKGAERAERLSRSEILRIRLSAVLPRHARRPRAGARARGDPVALRSRPSSGFAAGVQPGLDVLWRAHGRPGQRLRLGLGRAALSRLPRFRHRLGGRRQLGDRPLDHRPDRGRAARPADRARSCRISALPIRGAIPVDGFVDGYVIDRPMSARGALEPLLRLFGLDAVASRRRDRVAAAAAGARSSHLTKDDLVLARQGAVAALTRAQETELPQQVEVGFTEGEDGLPPRRRGLAPPVRLEPARGAGGQRRRHPPRRGAAPRRYLAAGPVGRAREAPSSSSRRGASSSSRAT